MTVSADRRGWGPGWPHCNSSKWITVRAKVSGTTLLVRREVAPIVQFLLDETERLGYLFDHGPSDATDDWGAVCRAIHGTSVPSTHSWGLAVDLDATLYPQGQTKRHLPQWVMDLWSKYGFDNGVPWSNPDPMHMEFRGTPADAAFFVNSLAAHAVEGTRPPLPISAQPPDPAIALIAAALLNVQEDPMLTQFIRSPQGAVYAIFDDATKKAIPTAEHLPVIQAMNPKAPLVEFNQRAFDLALDWHKDKP